MKNYNCISLTVFGLVMAYVVAAFFIGPATDHSPQREALPSPLITFTPTVDKQEDDPTWDCYEDGNRICGDPEQSHSDEAWASWDRVNGAKYLRVDPSRGYYRVQYIGTAMTAPELRCNQLAVPSLNVWYVFEATYMDGKLACP